MSLKYALPRAGDEAILYPSHVFGVTRQIARATMGSDSIYRLSQLRQSSLTPSVDIRRRRARSVLEVGSGELAAGGRAARGDAAHGQRYESLTLARISLRKVDQTLLQGQGNDAGGTFYDV